MGQRQQQEAGAGRTAAQQQQQMKQSYGPWGCRCVVEMSGQLCHCLQPGCTHNALSDSVCSDSACSQLCFQTWAVVVVLLLQTVCDFLRWFACM